MIERSDAEKLPRSCHIPVLVAEVLEWLCVGPGQRIVDGTVGGGGHASRILDELGRDGQLLGLDRDPAMLEMAATVLDHPDVAFTMPVIRNSRMSFPVRRGDRPVRSMPFCWTLDSRRINSVTKAAGSGLSTMARWTCVLIRRTAARPGNGWQPSRNGSWSSACGSGEMSRIVGGSPRNWCDVERRRPYGRVGTWPKRFPKRWGDVVGGGTRQPVSSRPCGLRSMTNWYIWSGRCPTHCLRASCQAGDWSSSRSTPSKTESSSERLGNRTHGRS